jgi:NhaP-type Na+/H+ or K+/H+ antiporter
MPRRMAVAVAMVVFAVCLVAGLEADNTFAETVRRALIGMFATLVIGLVVGVMGQKMLEENVKQSVEKSDFPEANPEADDR